MRRAVERAALPPAAAEDPEAGAGERDGRERVGRGQRERARLELAEQAAQLLALARLEPVPAADERAKAAALVRLELDEVTAHQQQDLADGEELEEGQAADGAEHGHGITPHGRPSDAPGRIGPGARGTAPGGARRRDGS